MTAPAFKADGHAGLTREEAWTLFDEQTRAYLNISADDFVLQYETGALEETPDVLYLLMVREFAV